ncbi:hypothetical protein SAMN04489835_4914 [Mycolicibacterium rutilum]|uniref:Uncharacterized protein n=1 Tax=Mycolicibacterium rutilum TaxID=370526 RepID=A0A1H6LAV8_MYCRU|nr:hypothetical protein [Mycolicibacterium rutilum]SEH85421.1 hypothetical protein SAMN04489835_4914 [Mycolicibacterium rutilum]
MATRSSTDDVVLTDGDRDGRVNRHQLTVLAADLADVVGLAGGWLFDRACAGWDVTVRVDGCRDARALTILGADPAGSITDELFSAPTDGALAVSATLLREDARVRAYAFETARRGDVEVMAWGVDLPDGLRGRIDPSPHQLSVAARAFKARALAAAELTGSVSATETLFDLRAEVRRLATV